MNGTKPGTKFGICKFGAIHLQVLSSPTSANFARSSLKVIRCSAATSCVTLNAMFLPRCPRHSGPSTVPIIAPGLRANIKSTGREVRRVLPGDRDAFKQAADGGGEESGKFRPRGGFRSVFILKQQTPLQFLFSALALEWHEVECSVVRLPRYPCCSQYPNCRRVWATATIKTISSISRYTRLYG